MPQTAYCALASQNRHLSHGIAIRSKSAIWSAAQPTAPESKEPTAWSRARSIMSHCAARDCDRERTPTTALSRLTKHMSAAAAATIVGCSCAPAAALRQRCAPKPQIAADQSARSHAEAVKDTAPPPKTPSARAVAACFGVPTPRRALAAKLSADSPMTMRPKSQSARDEGAASRRGIGGSSRG